jgi:hypothetical protein
MRAVTNKSNTAELKLTIRAVYTAYDKRGTVYNKRSTVHRTSKTDKSSISIFKIQLDIMIRTIAISGDPVADESLQGNPHCYPFSSQLVLNLTLALSWV